MKKLLLLLLLFPAVLTAQTEWLTPAEVADFEATPSYDETLAFLERIAARCRSSGSGASAPPRRAAADRRDPLAERAFTPAAAAAAAKPVVLV